jgi:membrane associated rhomboid family serine protease
MNAPPQMTLAFPKPGRALKVVLVAVLLLGIFNALLATWVPHGEEAFLALVCDFDKLRHGQLWRILSSGLLTNPERYGHLFFTLLGLYFLAPDLERRWGDGRLLRFLGLSVLVGNLTVIAVDALAPASSQMRFHPPAVYGASAAIAAIAVAWARENGDRTVNVFFVIPVRGRWLLWVTIGFCVLDLIYPSPMPEGVVAPFGGVIVGLLLAGSPSLGRTAWLRLKLFFLRRRAASLSVDDVLSPKPRRRARPASAPPLRVVSGGLEEALKKRTPPKDKRYLN